VWAPLPIWVLKIRKYFLSVPLVARDSTDSYAAGWSVFPELFGLHLVCRQETYPVTIFHITFYFPGWVCADLQTGYSSVAGFSSRINKVTTLSVQVGFVVELHWEIPPPINYVCPTQYHSTTDICLRLTHLPQKLYNLMFTGHIFPSLPVSLVISFCDVIKQLTGVEASSVA
jgi:hypothetical protein